MRKFKFRAWNQTQMEYSDNLEKFFAMFDDDYNKDPVMQFTGLQDMYGVDIYESDIVRHKTSVYGNVVVFNRGAFRLGEGNCAHTLLNRIETCEVIGNVHEKIKEGVNNE